MKASRADKAIRPILATCYPDWKGRKVRVESRTEYTAQNYWSEGSRRYMVAYDLASGARADAAPATASPFNPAAHATVRIPDGIAVVEHQIFCGRDAGVTIYVSPASVARYLPGYAPALDAATVPIPVQTLDECAAEMRASRGDGVGPDDPSVDRSDWAADDDDERSDAGGRL